MRADWVLFGGHIETMDAHSTTASAAAVAEGRFVAVGSNDEVRALCTPSTKITDLEGATVLPGFIDTHMHLEKIAREMAMIHLERVTTVEQLLGLVHAAAGSADGHWLRSFGDDGAWHEHQLTERRLPTRAELDRAAPHERVFLYRGPDAAVLSSAAADVLAPELEPLTAESWEPESGLLSGSAARELESKLPAEAPERRRAQLADASTRLLQMGVTSVVDPGLPARFASSWKLYLDARAEGALHQRLVLMNRLDPQRRFDDELNRFLDSPRRPGEGDDRLRAGALKLILDGEFDNAWMRPGETASGQALRRYTPDEIRAAVDLCAEHGWPLCVHAMGGGAIECVIEAVRDVIAAGAELAPAQVSIAHAFLASEANARECASLGIALSVQPMLAYVFEEAMCEAWGALAQRANPLATMLRAGVAVAGGSDTLPCEPLRGARYAVDRIARHGTVLGADETIAPRDAVGLFTGGAGAYLQRDDIGTIAPGSLADLVVWDENPLTSPPERWLDLSVELAAVDGEIAWSA